MATVSTEPQTEKLDQILGALTNLGQQVQDLARRTQDVELKVKQQNMRTAKFEPMQPPSGVKPRVAWNELNGQVGQPLAAGRTLPVSATGLLTPYAQIDYPEGTIVRLNPESELYQRLKDRYEAKQSRVNPDEVQGPVVGLHYVNDAHKVKYRCVFNGLTREKRGDGFWQDDLMPA